MREQMTNQTLKKLRRDSLDKYLRDDGYPSMSDTASAQECTGLFPTPPKTEAEYESLRKMHGMQMPSLSAGRGEKRR